MFCPKCSRHGEGTSRSGFVCGVAEFHGLRLVAPGPPPEPEIHGAPPEKFRAEVAPETRRIIRLSCPHCGELQDLPWPHACMSCGVQLRESMDVTIAGHAFEFTGGLRSMKRAEAVRAIEARGGRLVSEDREPHYLVIGDNGNRNWSEGTFGTKIWCGLYGAGARCVVEVVTESEFLTALKRTAPV